MLREYGRAGVFRIVCQKIRELVAIEADGSESRVVRFDVPGAESVEVGLSQQFGQHRKNCFHIRQILCNGPGQTMGTRKTCL